MANSPFGNIDDEEGNVRYRGRSGGCFRLLIILLLIAITAGGLWWWAHRETGIGLPSWEDPLGWGKKASLPVTATSPR